MAGHLGRHEVAPPADEPLLRRIRGEYLEMPGLRLTRAQAQRLWGLDEGTCTTLLDRLVDRKFLVCAPDGKYMRLTDGNASPQPHRMAKADLSRESKYRSR